MLPVCGLAQTLRGIIRDADSGLPVAGANVTLVGQTGLTGIDARTDSAGQFSIAQLRAGYYNCSVQARGFDNLTIAEINVAAGKERLLNIGLHRTASQLPEVTIAAEQPARRPAQPLSEIPLTHDQTMRFPATFFDPARLAMAYPGVAQTDDGTNPMSIRGNSPATVRWRLAGVDVVNPNHLPNGGTINDRPAAASGGVLMFSTQLLDNSALLTGAFPAGYGDAISGVMDMYLRPGNNRRHEFTTQASLIGLDVAAEGPMSKQKRASYLVNYRYSTVGLLSQMGVSFGDEQINFQDLSFNLNFPTKKGGSWSVFGMGGSSENIFRHKTDSTEIKVDKDRHDIDFHSLTAIVGGTGRWSWGRNTLASLAVVASGQDNDWSKTLIVDGLPDTNENLEDNRMSGIISARLELRHTWGGFRLSEGLQTAYHHFLANGLIPPLVGGSRFLYLEGNYIELAPWLNGTWTSTNGRWVAQAGLQSLFHVYQLEAVIDPRASLTMRASARHSFSIAGGLYSQSLPAWMQYGVLKHFLRSPQLAVGHTWRPDNFFKVHSEVFFQYQKGYPVTDSSSFVSWFNQPEQLSRQFFYYALQSDARSYGLEVGVEKTLQGGWFLLANTSIFRSNFRFRSNTIAGPWLHSRWDLGHLANFTLGKEWARQPSAEKARAFGLNGRVVWTGGPREAQLDLDAPANGSFVAFKEREGYTRQNADYFRIDLRAYWQRSLGDRRNSTFAMDLQNVTMQKNVAYHYYDPFTKQVETKYQLGLIPNISWRLEF